MMKAQSNESEAIDTKAFAQFNTELFYDPTIEPDSYTPLQNAANMEITPFEL